MVVKPFNGQNFADWKLRIELLLDEKDLLECVTEEPNPDNARWKKKDKKCKSLIAQHLEDPYLEHVREHQHAHEVWESLCSTYEKRGPASKRLLLKQISELKYDYKKSLETHFVTFDKIMRQLKDVGSKLDESDYCCMLLNSLPKQFEGLVTSLETHYQDEEMKMEQIKRRLLEHGNKLKDNSGELPAKETAGKSIDQNAFSAKKQSSENFRDKNSTDQGPKCEFCGRRNHEMKDCVFHKRFIEKQANVVQEECENEPESDESESELAFLTQKSHSRRENSKISWYLDSGASNHYVNSDKLFVDQVNLSKPVLIKTANSDTLQGTKIGRIKGISGSSGRLCSFNNVYYVPGLRHNLLSVRAITARGFDVIFKESSVQIQKNGSTVACGTIEDNLYRLDFEVNPPVIDKSALYCKIKNNMKLWHRRVGHKSMSSLEKLVKANALKEIDINDKNSQVEVCKECAEGRMTKLPWKNKTTPASRPLEVIHSDIFGPVSEEMTSDRTKYFISFLDEFTHFSVIYLMKNKSEAFDKFVQYVNMATSKMNSSISRLKCNNGAEYKSEKFQKFCIEKGIQIEYTVPFTPELNGKAERLNRLIAERARAMISDSGMPKSLWPQAVTCAVYLINRSVTVNNKIPAEMWYNKPVDLSNIKVFGCRASALIPKEKRSEFDSKALECFMVGYMTNGYRLFHDGEFITARNVIFDESKRYSDFHKNEVQKGNLSTSQMSPRKKPTKKITEMVRVPGLTTMEKI